MKKTITRADLTYKLMNQLGLTRQQSSTLITDMFDEISRNLSKGNNVKISSFGTFVIREKGLRMGRNPRTGKDAPIRPRQVVTFRSSPLMKESVKNGK